MEVDDNTKKTADKKANNESELITSAKMDDAEEFEEFPIYDAGGAGMESGETTLAEINVWEDNWDDETIETDFHKQLAEELKKCGQKT